MGKRLGRFRADPGDHWWVLRQGVDADAIADEIATLIRTAVVPFLDRYGSDAGLLSLPQTGEAHIAQWLVDQLNAAASAEQA